MGVISIVNGDYKPTNITGGYHLVQSPLEPKKTRRPKTSQVASHTRTPSGSRGCRPWPGATPSSWAHDLGVGGTSKGERKIRGFPGPVPKN